MKNRVEHILCGATAVVILAVVLTGLAGNRKLLSGMHCCGIEVEVLDSNRFTDEAAITQIISRDFGGYRNRLCDSVNLFKLEKVLTSLPYIRSGEAYFTGEGMLHVVVRQQEPCFKFNCKDRIYYVCPNCQYVNVEKDWCSGIPCITGKENQLKDREWTEQACLGAGWISSERKWSGKVKDITCDEKGEIMLRIAGRTENFIIGRPDDVERKFSRIDTYLTKVAPDLETNGQEYKYVNVKYNGQIVCK